MTHSREGSSGIHSIFTTSPSSELRVGAVKAALVTLLARCALVVMALILMGALVIGWIRFHPQNATPVVGPAGKANRAFIENRSFGDLAYSLCVSDWPHTFAKPVALGSVLYSEGGGGRIFWSADGSVVVVREGYDVSTWAYTAAYDFNKHEILRHDPARVSMLLASRGGPGQEQPHYPEGKENY